MIAPALLRSLFLDSHTKIKEHTAQITHAESVQSPVLGANCIHWIVGHIVVARCNFLMLLDTPSVGEQLATYAAHEAYHAGQLEILRQGMGK